jgi:hypothetical protein
MESKESTPAVPAASPGSARSAALARPIFFPLVRLGALALADRLPPLVVPVPFAIPFLPMSNFFFPAAVLVGSALFLATAIRFGIRRRRCVGRSFRFGRLLLRLFFVATLLLARLPILGSGLFVPAPFLPVPLLSTTVVFPGILGRRQKRRGEGRNRRQNHQPPVHLSTL